MEEAGGSGEPRSRGGGDLRPERDRIPSMADNELEKNLRKGMFKQDQIKKADRAIKGRVRQQLQSNANDIRIFRIGFNAGKRGFKRLILERYKYMCHICSTTIGGRPITPPEVEYPHGAAHPAELRFRVHIVEIVDPNRGDVAQLLFNDSNFYFTAFRTLLRGEDVTSMKPWYKFTNEDIPSFFTSVNIGYDSGYENFSDINIGEGSLENIYHTMRRFTPGNAKRKNKERHRAVRGASLIFSETQRLEEVQEEVLQNLSLGRARNLKKYTTFIHNWCSHGKEAFRKGVLEKGCKVLIFKYHAQETPDLILRQELAMTAVVSLAGAVVVAAAVQAVLLALAVGSKEEDPAL